MEARTPLGNYPFEFRRLGRTEGGVEVVGIVAGLESGVVVSDRELAKVGLALLVATAALALLSRATR